MFYLFHGTDSYSQQETLDSLIARLGDPSMLSLNTARFEGSVSLGELRGACDAVPFLAPVRLVLCKGLFEKQPAKRFLDELYAYLPAIPETTRLVFLETKTLPTNHKLVKLADKLENGFIKKFDAPAGPQLERWVRQQAKMAGGTIEPQAASILATNVGGNLQILASEVEKLVLYKGDDGPITAQDVALLSPYAAESNIFNLVDALGSRNSRHAALLLHQKMSEGADPFFLFAMIVRQFRLLIQVKALADEGERPLAIGKALRLHSFVAGKIFQQSQQFSLLTCFNF